MPSLSVSLEGGVPGDDEQNTERGLTAGTQSQQPPVTAQDEAPAAENLGGEEVKNEEAKNEEAKTVPQSV